MSRTSERKRTAKSRGKGKSKEPRKGTPPAAAAPPAKGAAAQAASAAKVSAKGPGAVDRPALPASFRIRSATAGDAAAISALWMELCRLQEPAGNEWVLAEGAAERCARNVQAAVGAPRMLYLVAEMEDGGARRIAGFLHARVTLRSSSYREAVVGEIPAMLVTSDARGRGVGTALVGAAMEWLAHREIRHLETTIPAAAGPGRPFFQALGFRESAAVMWAAVPALATKPAEAGEPSAPGATGPAGSAGA